MGDKLKALIFILVIFVDASVFIAFEKISSTVGLVAFFVAVIAELALLVHYYIKQESVDASQREENKAETRLKVAQNIQQEKATVQNPGQNVKAEQTATQTLDADALRSEVHQQVKQQPTVERQGSKEERKQPQEKQPVQKTKKPLPAEPFFRYVYDNPGCCWVESLPQVEELMEQVRKAVSVTTSFGFEAKECVVGGGVHELDTGYEDFFHRYNSFDELDTNLIQDYKSKEATLRGTWLHTLNFEYIEIRLIKADMSFKMMFCRGVLELCGNIDKSEEMQAMGKQLQRELKE